MPGAPGAEFRLRLTREQCVKGWEISLDRTLAEIEHELATNDEDWKKDRALRGYAAEGVHMSIKQMSGQLLSVDIADQERYIDLQRMRARQIWDECKHSKLHADVLLGKGWIENERELMDIAQANAQPLPAYFGLSMMFPHIHPLARAAQNYYTEANACIGIMAYLDRVDDPLVRHEHLSPARRGADALHGRQVPDRFPVCDARDAAAGRRGARLICCTRSAVSGDHACPKLQLRSCPDLIRASTRYMQGPPAVSPWMAGTSPAKTRE